MIKISLVVALIGIYLLVVLHYYPVTTSFDEFYGRIENEDGKIIVVKEERIECGMYNGLEFEENKTYLITSTKDKCFVLDLNH